MRKLLWWIFVAIGWVSLVEWGRWYARNHPELGVDPIP